ncbi:hypothetical protein NLU13_2246 [Sarocladium strictum]|uniref:R3H domain-containing protein n=1 Tax=Sarocladium strictum TaxID=5046 RepID=A0AA39GSQ8_SARSR|nr:hypothetical protein NLU13_2246 [Sarocladium strictum]
MEAPAQAQTQTASRGGPRNERRGRRGNPNGRGNARGGRRGGGAQNTIVNLSEPSAPTDTASIASSDVSSNPRGRGSRRARGGQPRRGGPPPARGAAGAGRRAFGGRLTQTDAEANESSDPSLSAEAAEFVPGQPVVRRSRPTTTRPLQASRPSVPKSTADDFGTRVHEDISNHNYECTICTDEVLRSSKIWTCTLCWTTVHQKCVQHWYRNQKAQWNEQQAKNPTGDFRWRCPGCNSNLVEAPATYHCWCGKELSPSPASKALPPHSCGQTCSKPRPTCPHPCFLQCHAGPCPPCDLMGPVQSCFCGKNTSQKLCRETDYENGESCGETCGDLLPCGEHTCSRPCHSGVCGDCNVVVEARCFCGSETKEIVCSSREDPQGSYDPQEGEFFEGSFSCSKPCERLFDCGSHKCSKPCHAQDEQAAHCPHSPDVITTCPCGKTDLATLLANPRQSCQDPIPRCNEPCEKTLPCGHSCQAKCHTGDCGSCNLVIDIACRCGRTTTRSLCHQGDLQPPQCMRVCQANLNCARHKCGERCCTGEKKAIERQAAKRKQKLAAHVDLTVEAEHICIRTCDRLLKCGLHNCQQICHRGPCASCPEAIFDEIACDCGRTVLQPPQPCGTQPPACQSPCRRRPECGHPPVDHHCHGDDKTCPKCPFQVKRWCACGKRNMPNQPCHLQEAHCGLVCGKKLKCGLHSCRKLCHKPGECEDEGAQGVKCSQACGRAKLFCDHKCQQACHGAVPCNESIPCSAKTTISCPCGIQTQEVKCAATSSSPNPERAELKCDDECLRQDRNRRLAAALNIDPSTHTNDHVPYSDTTLALFRENRSWAETQEREFRVFSQSPSEVRLQYKAMPREQRQFLHALADDYGLESRSEDEEPYRYVVVYKGQRYVSAPSKTIGQCIKIRDAQAAEAAATAAASRNPTPPPIFKDDPFNAFLLLSPRFGLTAEEVTDTLQPDLAKASSSFTFSTYFLPTDEVAIRATAHYSSFLHPSAVEQELATLKPRLAETLGKTNLAGSVVLCHLSGAEEVTRREVKGQQDGSGWSAVAGRGAAVVKKTVVEEKGTGRKLLGLRKKKIGEQAKEKPWAALGSDVEC